MITAKKIAMEDYTAILEGRWKQKKIDYRTVNYELDGQKCARCDRFLGFIFGHDTNGIYGLCLDCYSLYREEGLVRGDNLQKKHI